MANPQPVRVQRRAPHDHRFFHVRGRSGRSARIGVADADRAGIDGERAADVREVHTDLVPPPGERARLHERVGAVDLEGLVER